MGDRASPEVLKAVAWLNSFPKASKWMRKYDLLRLLDKGSGLVRIKDFLPEFVAEAVLQVLQAVPAAKWNETAAGEDYVHNNISHQFYSTKHASAIIDAVVRVIGLLLPEQLNAFSAARYDRSHHIAPHDDRAYTPVLLDTGEVITCSREIGVIWYLTKGWREEYGGALVDLEAPGGRRTYVPLFNSAVAFRVPRFHEVTPVATARPRYSLFGWFLQPGQLYNLYTGEGEGAGGQHRQENGGPEEHEGQGAGPVGQGQRGRLSLGAGGGKAAKRRHAGVEEAPAPQRQQPKQQPKQRPHQQPGGEYACKLARRIAANVAKRGSRGAEEL